MDELREQLAARTRELDVLRSAKDQELQAVWDHAHKLNQALQRLDAFVHASGLLNPSAGVPQSGNEMLAHAVGPSAPVVPSVIVPDFATTQRDIRIAERLLRAYRLAAEDERRGAAPRGDSWAWIKTQQAEFFEVLDRGDPVRLAEYLGSAGRRDATVGIELGRREYERIRSDPAHRDRIALLYKDKLLSLAEAVGAVMCENPEQGRWGQSLHADADELAAKIEQALGVEISPPVLGGTAALETARGLFTLRDCSAIFTAWSLRQILGPLDVVSLCEIGAGCGKLAYWCNRFGAPAYTVFDLPHVNVIQGYYLLRNLPEDRVYLHGEWSPAHLGAGTAVLPYFRMGEVPPRAFDLVLNQDSFPEIEERVVRGYLDWIKSASRRYFYSINHESRPPTIGGGEPLQLCVPELVAAAGGFRRLSRTPYWLRRGYVAELYSVVADA